MKKTIKHDLSSIVHNMNNLMIDISKHNVNIIGDAGYITDNLFDVNCKMTKIVTPHRINQNKILTYHEKDLLSKRHVVENSFVNLKDSPRIMVRKDKKINNFMSFVYMTVLECYIKKMG